MQWEARERDVTRILSKTSSPICWPFRENCHAWRVFTPAAIMAQDFTLLLNQHYMANWVALAFLFFPQRRVLVPALLVSF